MKTNREKAKLRPGYIENKEKIPFNHGTETLNIGTGTLNIGTGTLNIGTKPVVNGTFPTDTAGVENVTPAP